MDHLQLLECLLTIQETIINGYSQIIDLWIKQNTFLQLATWRINEQPIDEGGVRHIPPLVNI